MNRNRLLSPLDSRYQNKTVLSRSKFSDFNITKLRLMVEVDWLIYFSHRIDDELEHTKSSALKALFEGFNEDSYEEIKKIEETTKHDVKALEYFLKKKMQENNISGAWKIHFGLTSQDIVDTAIVLAMDSYKQDIFNYVHDHIIKQVKKFVDYQHAMMSRTHGQPATQTTIGKEFTVYMERLQNEIYVLADIELDAKFGGSNGMMSSLVSLYPDISWRHVRSDFIGNYGIRYVSNSTQVNNNDTKAQMFHSLIRINNILIDMCRDVWHYMALGHATIKRDKGYVGSSVMAHKTNPIEFENAEGNLELANANLAFLADKLTKSRMHRDLSDTTVIRNIGHIFGYCELAYNSVSSGLSNLVFIDKSMKDELDENYQILSEYVQLYLKKVGIYGDEIFEQVKHEFRLKKMNKPAYLEALKNLNLEKSDLEKLEVINIHAISSF